MDRIDTIDTLFDRLGGASAVARLIGKGASTASEMKRRGSIPVRYWGPILDSETGREYRLTPADMVRLNTSRRAKDTGSPEAAEQSAASRGQ